MLQFFATQTSTSLIGGQGERLVNWFLRPTSGATEAELIAASGVVPTADVGAAINGAAAHQGKVHVSAGGRLWRVSGATVTDLGSLPLGPAQMASSGRELAIVAGGSYYLWDGTTLGQYDIGQLETAIGVTYTDGYFVVIGSDATRGDAFTVSALDDGKTFAGLEFAFAESSPDDLVGIVYDHGELWLFGERSIEVWFNAAGIDFPFQRNSGATRERGCLLGATITKEDNSVFWVGEDRVVYRAAGGPVEAISTRTIEETLKGADVLGGFAFKDRGHKFYAVRTSKTTLCLDLTTGLWSERARGGDFEPWSVNGAFALNGNQVLTTEGGRIAAFNESSFEDDGTPIVCLAQSRPIIQQGQRFSVSDLKVFFRGGLIASTETPKAMLQTSHDGREWGREKWRPIGGLGSYGYFARWLSLGQFRRMQFRLKVSSPVQRDILGITYG